jgi:hypothetical protein
LRSYAPLRSLAPLRSWAPLKSWTHWGVGPCWGVGSHWRVGPRLEVGPHWGVGPPCGVKPPWGVGHPWRFGSSFEGVGPPWGVGASQYSSALGVDLSSLFPTLNMLFPLINISKFEIWRKGEGRVRGRAEEKEGEEKRVKINLKVSTKFQVNPSTDGREKTFEAIWRRTIHPSNRQTIRQM